MMHTCCKNCVFATYIAKTQISCDLGKISQYRKQGAEIIEAYDDEKEFFIINGRICNTMRKEEWGKKSDPEKWEDRVNKEIEIKYSVIIFNTHTELDPVLHTIQSLTSQLILPSYIHIINLTTNPKLASKLSLRLERVLGSNIKWQVEQPVILLDNELKYVDRLYSGNHINTMFYAIMYSGFTIMPEFFEILNTRINHKLEQCISISTPDIQVFSTPVHSFLEGNKGQNLLDKIKEQQPEAISYE